MKPDFTFARDDSQRYLPWHIGIMVALASLLLFLVASLGKWVGTHRDDYRTNIAVLIPGTLENLENTSNLVKNTLEKNPSIAAITRINDQELRDSLKPWLGDYDSLTETTLPIVFDVKLRAEAAKSENPAILISELNKILSEINPAIDIDEHESWAELFSSFIHVMQIVSMILAIAVLAAMTMVIMFSARASLHLHKNTVNLLHEIGAEDDYIARQFQNEHAAICLRAAAAGVACALGFYIILAWWIGNLGNEILPRFDLSSIHIAIAVLIPPACLLIVIMATRYSVLSQLKKAL